MKAVLLAGGLGTRIAEESDHRPKPMIELGGRPILWHIMKIYAHHGITDFIVCCGYKGYMIKEYFANYRMHNSDLTVDLSDGSLSWHATAAEPWRVTLVDTGLETMTGGRLRRIAAYLDPDEPFCMTYGDGVGDIDISALVAFHRGHGRAATLTAVVPPGRYGALDFDGQRVARFIEKPPGDNALINGGFFVLHPSVVDRIADDTTSFEGAPLTGLAADGELMAFRHTGFWRPMDTLRDKRQLEELWEQGAPWKVWE
ncbi:glucose-1-phosphate cytidylyltransferase [Limibaculum sp. M0105]|uniref:Glucose-1-phosphate cytidylyltransferase n=1 Tax=Thermohalobaculum xanthum TaxID=2753746 RepID=A0A8J7SCX3_9RHOB|nr:glucose-1-phosphate cytidylyltransferase [Thermohalobaculum xanthum]MBK0398908.1 glucose-1-phosphate cytidylyltransferase [Thermohalobaculum xanthum]